MWDFKSLCGAILWGQLKVKKVSVLYYSIDFKYHRIAIAAVHWSQSESVFTNYTGNIIKKNKENKSNNLKD